MLLSMLMAGASSSGGGAVGGGVGTPLNQIISANVSTYNVRTAASSPGARVDVTVTVAPGVRVGSMNTGSGWTTGSTIKLVNHGIVQGPGGNATAAGGDALSLGWDIVIDNSDGQILGGGGGGSPAAGGVLITGATSTGGGGGGGGQGYPGGTGGNGTGGFNGGADGATGQNGTPDAPGAGGGAGAGINSGGSGGYGGSSGVAGGNSDANNAGTIGTSTGAAGRAIRLNGHGVSWLGGNDSLRVKGAVL